MSDKLKVNMNEYLPLRDVVFNTLRQAIITGEFAPGERLMEIALANRLGVSRTPVREAIRKLELEGLVVMIPRKGAEVARITEKDLRDVLEVRCSLEELAAELYKGNVVKYLLVPEDVEVPVGLDQDMIIVKMPADKTYVASDEILEQMKELDLLDSVAAVGMEQKACTVPEIAEKMQVNEDEDEADAEVIYGGSFEKPELKALVKKEVSLALLPGELLPRDAEDAEKNDDAKTDSTKKDSAKTEDKKTKEQSTGDSDELTVEEQTERLEEITEKFALLGIPVIIDRSADEKTELAQYEWIKVYGVLFGCEEKMDKMFEKAVDEAGVQENQ